MFWSLNCGSSRWVQRHFHKLIFGQEMSALSNLLTILKVQCAWEAQCRRCVLASVEHREGVYGQRLLWSLLRYKTAGQKQWFACQHELYGALVTSPVLWPMVTVRSLWSQWDHCDHSEIIVIAVRLSLWSRWDHCDCNEAVTVITVRSLWPQWGCHCDHSEIIVTEMRLSLWSQ